MPEATVGTKFVAVGFEWEIIMIVGEGALCARVEIGTTREVRYVSMPIILECLQ